MEPSAINSILHPTDLSPGNETAFAHALRLAVSARGALHVLHIEEGAERDEADRFPDALKLLTRWKMLEPGAALEQIEPKLGLKLIRAVAQAPNIAEAVGAYTELHSCDLLVLMAHALNWMERLFTGSLAEESARLAHAPALFLREGDNGFVDRLHGGIKLRRVLMPVAADVGPMHAWGFASNFVRNLEPLAEFRLIHMGDTLPTFGNLLPHVDLMRGPIVETILEIAEKDRPDLIAMATAGHQNLFDEVQGSTTERVLREAPCPVLAIPSRQYHN
jgi:nucleotide-binding universal stress UspA family protein